MSHTICCMRSDFSQALDFTRPHTLLTENSKRSGNLEYRYDDTGESTLVPNIWYNQTYQVRVEAIRWDAKLADERAAQYDRNPPFGMHPDAAADIARRYRERATRIRAEADKMEVAGKAEFPVQASQVQVDYGPQVGLV